MESLPVMESFYTIQGEGFHQGKAAYFIRLGGCDVGCHWCDVPESWPIDKHPKQTIEKLADDAKASGTKLVVVTGGEPLMHNLDGLTAALHDRGLKTNIETSGAHPLTGSWDWVCLSPKKFKAPLQEVFDVADELKTIVYNKSDLEWSRLQAKQVNNSCLLYLQPEWSKKVSSTKLIVDFVKKNPSWQISIQSHKYIDVP